MPDPKAPPIIAIVKCGGDYCGRHVRVDNGVVRPHFTTIRTRCAQSGESIDGSSPVAVTGIREAAKARRERVERDWEEISRRYLDNESRGALAREYGVPPTALADYFEEWGIPQRSHKQARAARRERRKSISLESHVSSDRDSAG